MTRRRVALGLALFVLVYSGIFVFVYLYRWEWNRAIVAGVVFLAAEVAILGWALHGKLDRIERRADADRVMQIRDRMVQAQRERSHVFDWLDPRRQQAGVFLPIFMASGLLLSALAWLVERLARATVGRASDHTMANELASLTPPKGGFLDNSSDPLRDLRGPAGRRS
jgi:hypothetical protein